MTRIIYGILAIILCTTVIAPPALARQDALSQEQLRKLPGYVDFGDIWQWSDGDEEVEIDLTQPLLGVVGAFVGEEDPELSDLITGLHLVRVNSFSYGNADRDDVRNQIDGLAKDLRGDGWSNIVKVRERDQRVNVFVKFEGDQRTRENTFLSGLAVLVFEEDEATFVNIVGRFRLEDIAKVGQQFDLPGHEEWENLNKRSADNDEEGDI